MCIQNKFWRFFYKMEKVGEKKILAIGWMIVGIAAIVFAIICFCSSPCYKDYIFESMYQYGGDAYTGIQNAAAATANNVNYLGKNLANATDFFAECMGYLLLIGGLVILLVGTKKVMSAFGKKAVAENNAQNTLDNNN